MNKYNIFSLLMVGSVLAGCQTAKDDLMQSGGIKMTQAEVIQISSNMTAPWVSGEGAGYSAPDGTYHYKRNSGETGTGKWSVLKNGTECLQVEEFWGKNARCNWETYKRGDEIFLYDIEKAKLVKIDMSKRYKGNQL